MDATTHWAVIALLAASTAAASAPSAGPGGATPSGDSSAAGTIQAAVGSTQYVRLSAGVMTVVHKDSGRPERAPRSVSALFAAAPPDAGMQACARVRAAAARLAHDHMAMRWISVHVAPGPAGYLCLAVSSGPDATGPYTGYALPVRAMDALSPRIDTPLLAVWPDALYLSFNRFAHAGNARLGPRLCAIGRAALLHGADAVMRCRDLTDRHGPLTPASLAPHAAVPDDAAALFAGLIVSDAGRGKHLVLRRFSFTRDGLGEAIAVAVAPFNVACAGVPNASCITQPPGGMALPAFSAQLAPGVVFDGSVLLANHTVTQPDGQAGVRWYEVHDLSGMPRIRQHGTYAPDRVHRWMGSIATDPAGNIALGYSVSGHDTPPGIRYTSRQRSDAPGRMRSESYIVHGSGVSSAASAGTVAAGALSLDPVDRCTFWYTQPYVERSGSLAWQTRTTTFRFHNCR